MSTSADFFEAAATGDIEYLKQHVQKSKNAKNERGWTALHFAARFGQLEAAQLLKDSGADLTLVNGEGKTASQVATFWGNDAIAKLLAVAPPPPKEEVAGAVSVGSPFPDNYSAVFAGNSLNRFGWNRSKPEFLGPLARSPKSNYIVLNDKKALYNKQGRSLQLIKYNQVSSIVDRVYTEDGINEENYDVILVFLGINEQTGKGQDGEGYWALDLTPKGKNEQEYSKLIEELEATGENEFAPTLPRAFVMDKSVSSIIAQAAAMVDWNARNIFCSACGKRTISEEAGHKRSCIKDSENVCISHNGVQNFTYPRTDAVVIVCIVHPNGDKILLGRNKRWPGKMYSCIAGFVEAAETLEEAVRREAFEEAGVIVDRVAYHSSQPWPFPNSLMLGFIAEASTTEIDTSLDKELESAQWFTRAEVIAALKGEPNAVFGMAPKGALAHTLIDSWVHDKKWQTSNL